MKGNFHKKMTSEDKFIKRWCCSGHNHPEGYSWWKRKARKDFRRQIKKENRYGSW